MPTTPVSARLFDTAWPLIADLDRIAAQITTLHDQLSVARQAPALLQKQLKAAELRLSEREAELTAEVGTETVGETAKLAYGNEALRKAETKRRLTSDGIAQRLVHERDALEHTKLNADLKAAQVQDLIAAVLAVQRIKVAETELLAAMIAATTPVAVSLGPPPPAPPLAPPVLDAIARNAHVYVGVVSGLPHQDLCTVCGESRAASRHTVPEEEVL